MKWYDRLFIYGYILFILLIVSYNMRNIRHNRECIKVISNILEKIV